MQSEIPTETFIWGILAPRFQSELTLKKSGIWRLSGLRLEYGGPADGDTYRERELSALIAELAGLLLLAVIYEAANRRSMKKFRRGAGRPRDVVLPFLGPKLLAVFLRCNASAGRQSVVMSGDGKQTEAGQLLQFITTIIQPLNQYFVTELHRRELSASRMARLALAERHSVAEEMKQSRTKAPAKKAAVIIKRSRLERAVLGSFRHPRRIVARRIVAIA
jgi:hypothetical protein